MGHSYELLFNGTQLYVKKDYNISYSSEFKNEVAKAFEKLVPQNIEIAPYIRHLYQTVKYIATQPENLFTYEEKRQYLRVLRAQLSTDEQIMLFYNWYAGFGKEWEANTKRAKRKNKFYEKLFSFCYIKESVQISNHFFTDYRMIHNLLHNLMIPDIANLMLSGQK